MNYGVYIVTYNSCYTPGKQMHLFSHTPINNNPAEKDSGKCQLSFDLRHKLEMFAYSMLSMAVWPYSYFSLKVLFELFPLCKKKSSYKSSRFLCCLAMELAVLRAVFRRRTVIKLR